MSERWTIQGVDRALREQVSGAAKAAGQSVGEWVASALHSALTEGGKSPGAEAALAALAMELGELRSRVDRLESQPRPAPQPVAPPAQPAPTVVAKAVPRAAVPPPAPKVVVARPVVAEVLAETSDVVETADMVVPLAKTTANRLSEATRQRICELAGRSYSVLQISKKTGVRVSVVEKVLRSMGRENLQVKIL